MLPFHRRNVARFICIPSTQIFLFITLCKGISFQNFSFYGIPYLKKEKEKRHVGLSLTSLVLSRVLLPLAFSYGGEKKNQIFFFLKWVAVSVNLTAIPSASLILCHCFVLLFLCWFFFRQFWISLFIFIHYNVGNTFVLVWYQFHSLFLVAQKVFVQMLHRDSVVALCYDDEGVRHVCSCRVVLKFDFVYLFMFGISLVSRGEGHTWLFKVKGFL